MLPYEETPPVPGDPWKALVHASLPMQLRPALNPPLACSPVPPVPIRKEVEGSNLVWPLFLLPQGWQWDSKVPLWLDETTTNASSAGTSALQLTVPSLDRQGLPPRQPPLPAAVSTRRCEAVANRSCGCCFPNTS